MAVKRRVHWATGSTQRKRRQLIERICCEICYDSYSSQIALRSHQLDRHKGNEWRCDVCCLEMKFSSSDLGKYIHDCVKKHIEEEQFSPKFHNEQEKHR